MSDMRFSETWMVFRQRDDGAWTYMGEETIVANHSLVGRDSSALVIRGFMSRSGNAGGTFAAVRKSEWKLQKARRPSVVVEAA